MHAALWTTVEAEDEAQPQRHVDRDFWLAADARVDNRDELTAILEGTSRQPLHTDADLILAAYERWGAGLLDHVVGDFGFVLWDGEREELLVARDPFGLRPVFLARTPGGLVAASTLPAVLAGLDGGGGIDEVYLAGYLHGLPARDRTIWSGVQRLAPGHRRIVGRDHDVTARYWSPDLTPLVQSLDTTIEDVRSAFDEAVRCRLRTRDGVATDLSGGLDSSTVTVTAADLAKVHPISLVYRIDPEAFELPFIEAVVDHLGIEGHVIEADELTTLDAASDVRIHREPLYAVDATDTAAVYDVVSSLGVSVSLTGVGGDELLYGSMDGVPARARRSIRNAVLRWTADHADGMLSNGLRAMRARRARRDRPWLHAAFVQQGSRVPARGEGVGAARLEGYESPWNAPAYELTDRLAAERSVEVRYPFLDRRLVELGLRLPESQILAGGGARGLHRRAFGHRLPQLVRSRATKAELSGSFQRRVERAVSPEDAATALKALGDRVDPALLTEAKFEPRGASPTWHMWPAISAGLFVSNDVAAARSKR